MANKSPANQAPDDVVKKLSDLVNAGKYAEAQQLISGLLIAYPDDQRLVKAKTFLDNAAATAKSTDITLGNSPSPNSVAAIQSNPEDTADDVGTIGVLWKIDQESHAFKIVGVFLNSPASNAGLSPGLIVDKIDGTSIKGKSPKEVHKLVHGPVGTKVSLGLIDPGSGAETTIVLIRQKVEGANDTSPAQLIGMDKVDYNALIALARQAQQTTDLSQQSTLLRQFMDQSAIFLAIHPHEMLLWEFRAASAISLNDPREGYYAGQRLLAAGSADSNDSNLLQLLGQLKNKGWLDKQEAENHAKYDWLIGTWSMSWSVSWHARGVWPANHGAVEQSGNFDRNEQFSMAGREIDGYVILDSGEKGFNLHGYVLDSGEIRWFRVYLPAGTPPPGPSYDAVVRGQKAGETYYPSGWQPIISYEIGNNKRTMTMVTPSQDTNPTSENPKNDTVIFHFSKIDSTQN